MGRDARGKIKVLDLNGWMVSVRERIRST